MYFLHARSYLVTGLDRLLGLLEMEAAIISRP
jgi:hypothetical protein